MLLLVDIGNTKLKWAFLEAGQLRAGGSFAHAGALSEALTAHWCAIPVPSAIWVANVAGTSPGKTLGIWTDTHWHLTPRFAAAQRELLGVRNGYRDYRRLGVDRWLAMVAAYTSLRGAVLVVDCGTAATLDLVSEEGRHLGGLILPGLGMMRSALMAGTHLSADPGSETVLSLGVDTAGCIAAGARYALIGAVERTLAHARTLLGRTPALVLAGGDGALMHPYLAGRLEPDLVLRGLALLAQAE